MAGTLGSVRLNIVFSTVNIVFSAVIRCCVFCEKLLKVPDTIWGRKPFLLKWPRLKPLSIKHNQFYIEESGILLSVLTSDRDLWTGFRRLLQAEEGLSLLFVWYLRRGERADKNLLRGCGWWWLLKFGLRHVLKAQSVKCVKTGEMQGHIRK